MCELFGVSSKKTIKINNYLKEFYSHSEKHPHGWGLAIIQENQSIIEKQPIKATESQKLQKILSQEIYVKNALAHIRLATMGYTNSLNCHPFTKKDNYAKPWTLIHNGTIFKHEKIDKYESKQKGETDSERILLYIIDEINKKQNELKRPINEKESLQLIEEIITNLSKGNKLNIMIFNGQKLFIHTNYNNSLYYKQNEDTIYVSTRPLSEEKWKQFPINTLIVLKEGKVIYKGKRHEYEYIISEEDFNYIFENMSCDLKQKIISEFGDLNYAKEYQLHNQ